MSRHEETAWSIVSAVAVVAGLVIRIGGGLRIELPRRAALSGGLGLSLDEFHAPSLGDNLNSLSRCTE